MLVNSYKEFSVGEKVRVKKEILYEFIVSAFAPGWSSFQIAPVMEYAFNKENILTISEIDYDPNLLLPASFMFAECEGNLYYGQFIKSIPTFYLFASDYFKG